MTEQPSFVRSDAASVDLPDSTGPEITTISLRRSVGIVSDRIRRLAAAGAIVVLATHDLDLVDGLVTRVAIVRDGRLVSDEPAGGGGLRARYRAVMA